MQYIPVLHQTPSYFRVMFMKKTDVPVVVHDRDRKVIAEDLRQKLEKTEYSLYIY
jgi:glycerol-3-phosphate cytidylyltransferase-like family protein